MSQGINFNRFPLRADAIEAAAKFIAAWPLFQDAGCEGRATLVVADKVARFLDELLGGAVVVDDEGRLVLANDQRSGDFAALGVESRGLVVSVLASAESFTKTLRKLMATNAVDCEPLPVDYELSHKSSPSVGAPSGAVCDNPNPTDGELNPGAASSPNGAAPAPTQTTVQE